MFERLKDKNIIPTIEESMEHIGLSKGLFDVLDAFLINELNAGKEIKFSAHDRCWSMDYRTPKNAICGLYFEKDAIMAVVRLDNDGIDNVYNNLTPYTKNCIDNSPYRHRGYIEYRVLSSEHIEDIKTILRCRASRNQKSIAQK
jgi:hypothetical protein